MGHIFLQVSRIMRRRLLIKGEAGGWETLIHLSTLGLETGGQVLKM